ncbi:MAG: rubrerythrin family protein [Desulfobacteraceae bacterium 4572_130]|nr:MAG: rubrerythrin family protein [Desulfobacteraceae bacterium 4572_130]
MNKLLGTKTEKNLMSAFTGESQARNKYTYFAGKARKEGFREISETFEKIADQESQHAKQLFKLMKGGEVEITGTFPFGEIKTTLENLKSAANGENHEWTKMYPSFARIARDESFKDIAKIFDSIAIAEKYHEKIFLNFAKNIEENKVFEKDNSVQWQCINCGYVHKGKKALNLCPACAHNQAHFKVL